MSIKIIGLHQALKDIQKKGDKAVEAVKEVLADEATFIEINAVRMAPKSFAGQPLSFYQRIDKVPKNNGLTWNVGLQTEKKDFEIEAWFEFGTGLSAQQLLSGSEYDEDIRSLAETFKRSGDGTIKSKAYLFPNFFIVRERIVNEIKKEIEKSVK